MSTFQSFQSNTSDNSDVTITKPTSLAVGDLMVAGIFINSDGSGTVSVATPSGWTLEEEQSTSTSFRLYVFSKTADSADVAASNFTFDGTSSDGAWHMLGILSRITNYGIKAGETGGTGNNSTTLTLTGFTPSRSNCLFMTFVGCSDQNTPNVTAVAMATNNPTWTQQTVIYFNDANRDSALGLYTATRPEATATGNFTITVANTVGVDSHGAVIALSERVDGSVTPTTEVNAYALTGVQSAKLIASMDNVTTEAMNPTIWTPIDKS